ncbi:peptidase inhibitor family I36 protein [Amycolatopsis sp. NPDC059657]|uniref:peptidase inhibitor family I36 protein n=1 Tax=Amycolatopsis sp. NPDC059657 TaxID=3346899 RepID=UPI003670724B
MRKRLGMGLALSVASLATLASAGTASARVWDCPDWGVACAYIDANYKGNIVWQESSPGLYTYGGDFRKTSSIINRTSYTIKLTGKLDGASLCIRSGQAIRQLPKGTYADQLRAIEVRPSSGCTQWR